MSLVDKGACVIDNGLFTELAVTLAKSFERVYYVNSWVTAFPRSNLLVVGDGIADNIHRVESIWPILDDVDLFVFPDIYHGPLQDYLRKIGKRVWGSGLAEALEYKRSEAKDWIKKIGLPVAEYRTVHGIVDLRRHLQMHDDVYVKSSTRGDMETFHAKNYTLIEPRLDELEHVLGAKKHDYEFVVEEPIEAETELGYDGLTVDGWYPKTALFGVEDKDAAYLGKVTPYREMPKSLQYVNSLMSALFEELTYRGFWSSEIRVNDGVPYLIDPCCRMASPPGELYLYMIENLAEVMWAGAEGEHLEPQWRHEYAAQLVLTSDWAQHGWQPIEFPEELRDHVKLHYLTVKRGHYYSVPQTVPIPEFGAVVAGGATKAAAIKAVTEIAEQVQGYDVKFDVAALERAASNLA